MSAPKLPSRQYRIMRHPGGYQLVVTYGLMDTETLGVYAKQAQARERAKAHAARTGVSPIILT